AARGVVEEAFELVDIVLHGLPELRIRTIFVAYFVERLLALQRVEAAREDAALAAPVALPQFGGSFVVDHARDVDRERIERVHRIAWGALFAPCRLARRLKARSRRFVVAGCA